MTPSLTSPRLRLTSAWPEGYRAMQGLDRAVEGSGLDPLIGELVKVRASQINGCAYCLDLHLPDARAAGEDQRRLDVLAAWRETDLFRPAERAALALTEAVTRLEHEALDGAVDEARAQLGEDGLARLLLAIVVINAWNRLAITQGLPVVEKG